MSDRIRRKTACCSILRTPLPSSRSMKIFQTRTVWFRCRSLEVHPRKFFQSLRKARRQKKGGRRVACPQGDIASEHTSAYPTSRMVISVPYRLSRICMRAASTARYLLFVESVLEPCCSWSICTCCPSRQSSPLLRVQFSSLVDVSNFAVFSSSMVY
jgi:hypothetical protein